MRNEIKMKKTLLLFILICSIITYGLSSVDVFASEFCDEGDVKISDSLSSTTGGTSDCSTDEKSTNLNCYSKRYGGMRVALVDSNGNQVPGTKIVDIWFLGKDTDDIVTHTSDNLTNSTIFDASKDSKLGKKSVYFTQKKMRQSYIGYTTVDEDTIENNLTVVDSPLEYTFPNASKDMYTDSELNIGNKKILEGFTSVHANNEYQLSNDGYNVRTANSAFTVMKKIYCDANKVRNSNGNYSSTYLNKLLELMGGSISSGVDTYYIQYEPLVTWSNRSGNTSSAHSYAFYGTITEINVLFYYANSHSIKLKNKLGLTETAIFGGKGVPFNSSNAYNYREIDKVGIATLDSSKTGDHSKEEKNFDNIPNGIFVGYKGTNITADGKINEKGDKILDKSNSKFIAYGVGFLSLAEFPTCNDAARNIISKNDYNPSNYIQRLSENSIIKNTCFKNGVFDKAKCYQLIPEYIEYVGIASKKDSNGNELINLCEPVSCQNALDNSPILNASEYEKNSSKVYVDDDKIDEFMNSISDSNYDKGIYYLYTHASTYFPGDKDIALLSYSNYTQLGVPASCEGIPPCPAAEVIASCNVKNEFSLQDNANEEKCLKKGYAYTNDSKFQTSYDDNYTIKGQKGYCVEKVTFNLPSRPDVAEAGTLLKWGAADVEDTGKFGTMTVERTCTYGGEGLTNKDNTTINLSWIKSIDPKIELHYRDALPSNNWSDDVINSYKRNTPKSLEVSDGYDVEVYNINGTGLSLPSGNYDNINYNYNFNWNDPSLDKIKYIKSFTSKATFDINYGSNFKWYVDKSEDAEYVEDDNVEKDDTNEAKAQYVFIGYGLPTSFVTPTCTNYGSSKDGLLEGNGYMYITITDVGSKTDKSGYHFNNLIKWNLKDDVIINGEEKESNSIDKIVYSCNFDVTNKLFGNEYGKNCFYGLPSGLDVVFRTVQLIEEENQVNVAFPGRSGSGREMGENWNDLYEGNLDYFLKLLSPKIYSEEPMYRIQLTSSKIKEIRESNLEVRNAGLDPYTSKSTENKQGKPVLYEFSANKLAENTEEEFMNKFIQYDCSESDNFDSCMRTNSYNKYVTSKWNKYSKDKENIEKGERYYNPYKYAASEFLTTLHKNYGLTGLCLDTYGDDTKFRSNYYAIYEGCYSNIILGN